MDNAVAHAYADLGRCDNAVAQRGRVPVESALLGSREARSGAEPRRIPSECAEVRGFAPHTTALSTRQCGLDRSVYAWPHRLEPDKASAWTDAYPPPHAARTTSRIGGVSTRKFWSL